MPTDSTVERLHGYLARLARQYPDVWLNVDRLRAERGRSIGQWPSWCFMPLAGAYAIATGGGDDLPPQNRADVGVIGALAAWRPTQGIYRFDPTVAQALADTPLKGDLPADILEKMPEWCVYIETPGCSYLDAPSPGFFAFLESDQNDKRSELRLVIDHSGKLGVAVPIHLRASLLDGIECALAEAARQAEKHGLGPDQQAIMTIPPKMIAHALSPRVSLLLYLCASNSEIRDASGERTRPSRALATMTKKSATPRMFPPPKPTAWECGFRLGAAIRAAEERERSTPQGGTHASPKPHIRRAHWHGFWRGPRKGQQAKEQQEFILHWLPPLPVNVADELPVVPTIHGVEWDEVAAALIGFPLPDRQEFLCHACGHRWAKRPLAPPAKCPDCGSERWDWINCPACDGLRETSHVIAHLKELGAVIREPEKSRHFSRPYMEIPGYAGEFLLCSWCRNWFHQEKFRPRPDKGSTRESRCNRCDSGSGKRHRTGRRTRG